MLKAVFWDFGGVITSSPFESFNKFEIAHNLPENFLRAVNSTNPDDNEVDGINQNMIGFGLIGGGFFIVMIATVGYLIATKIKGGGTALTAMTALSAFRR